MNHIKYKLELIWLSLIALSLFAYIMGQVEYFPKLFSILLLLGTLIKGQLIIDYFMGMKQVKLKYRLIPTLWLTIVIIVIAATYYKTN
ncbi:MAG: cytochrome C oxidase subunit IV family protein [Sulfurovum sp.]|nr:cytochrome C oxidase subunit IV family protein [Sulfurovum sp.]